VGLLVAVELAISIIVRPIAGVLADRRERRVVAGVGALVYGASCLGYAVADSVSTAYAAAALGGLGGGLLWVAVRAIISERLAVDSGVFPRLMSSEETGSWVAFVVGLTLIDQIGYRGIFLACAAACLAASAVLLTVPRRHSKALGAPPDQGDDRHAGADAGRLGLGGIGRTLRPMLVAVVITETAESAVALLLLLHLQRGFELELLEIALVFLPGAIAMSLLPGYLHRLVERFGRSRVLMVASISSATFAAGLSWAPTPLVVAGLWVFSGVAWAAVIPIQQAVIAESSGAHVGRGMGLYEAAVLLGALVGVLAAGVLYQTSPWTVACLTAAAVILAGAVIVPRAVRALGVSDIPQEDKSGG
jgi:MFS family permease